MLLKLDHPKILADVITIISELVSEVRIRVNKDGFVIVAIDPANVALTYFKLPVNIFSQFQVEDEKIGINLQDLKSVLRRCSVSSSLVLQTKENNLEIEIHDKIARKFSLALIDIEQEDKDVPILDFSAKIEIDTRTLGEAIEDCSIVADACSMEIKEGKFIISAKGSLNSAQSEYSSDEVKIEGSEGRSKYSLEYLQKFIKAGKIAEKVKINFSKDYPLRLDFVSGSFDLAFVLAPRVETED